MIFELINWFMYLGVYINIINPEIMVYTDDDINKIIPRINVLTKNEIEYVLAGCVVYDKKTHKQINPDNFDIYGLSHQEIVFLISYSLFGINFNTMDELLESPKSKSIMNILSVVETKISHKFIDNDNDRYIFRRWGSNFIKFSFKPLIIQSIIKLIVNTSHYYFKQKYNFDYYVCEATQVGFLHKQRDPNKNDLLFIHGFGFGYIPYLELLKKLDSEYNLIIVVLPSISNYNYYVNNIKYFPSIIDMKSSIYNFLTHIDVKKVNILSHSFGTYITQLLHKDDSNKIIDKIIMIDPIIFWIGCFKMSVVVDNPYVRTNTLYNTIFDIIANALIYQCIYLNYVCCRVMFGPDFWIYDPSELENSNILLVLQKSDCVTPTQLIYDKIKNYNINCEYIDDPKAYHGSVLMDKIFNDKMNEILLYYKK